MGLTSDGVAESDVICVLFGVQVAYCLKKEGETEDYELVGEAYCHGIMGGEAMKDLSEWKYTVEEF
jgi:hypothetical protein